MTLYLIRHGTTETSGAVYAGRADVALSAEGREMALRLAQALADQPVALIMSSPLGRARDTAAPLARRLGLPVRTDPRLMEFDFGAYEGRSKRALGLKLRQSHAHVPVPGGEALIDVWSRAGDVLDSLTTLPLPPSAGIAVVGHFWINRMLFGRLTGLDFDTACRSRAYRPATGSVLGLPFEVDRAPGMAGAGEADRGNGADEITGRRP